MSVLLRRMVSETKIQEEFLKENLTNGAYEATSRGYKLEIIKESEKNLLVDLITDSRTIRLLVPKSVITR